MPFNDQFATEITQQLEKQDKRQMWADLAQKSLYPALAAGILFLFWRMLKSTKAEDVPVGLPIATGNGTYKNGAGSPHLVTVDVLNQLIRENPANMTQAVRSWMTRKNPNN
jgi:hypothetical protein